MAKLGQFLGLSAFETAAMTDYQANILAHQAMDVLFKASLANPRALSPSLVGVVRGRTARTVRAFRDSRMVAEDPLGISVGNGLSIGAPPEE